MDLTFFQRYSAQENHTTNNTMLMLRYVQQFAPKQFQILLSSLIGSENAPVIGPTFNQQEGVGTSILDAAIHQQAFSLYVEAKSANAQLNLNQLKSHRKHIVGRHGKGTAILVGLSKQPWADADEFAEKSAAKGLHFISVTYEDLLSELEALSEREELLNEIVVDYRDYLASQNLLRTHHRKLVAFPCKDTADDNVRTGVYYQPANRNRKQDLARYIGIYQNRCITHVGRISGVIVCQRKGSSLVSKAIEHGDITEENEKSIIEAIDAGLELYGGLAEQPHRYYIVEEFVEANFRKSTPYGMWGHRYFDLEDVTGLSIDEQTSVDDIARALGEHTFS